jgi:hypothetical protein
MTAKAAVVENIGAIQGTYFLSENEFSDDARGGWWRIDYLRVHVARSGMVTGRIEYSYIYSLSDFPDYVHKSQHYFSGKIDKVYAHPGQMRAKVSFVRNDTVRGFFIEANFRKSRLGVKSVATLTYFADEGTAFVKVRRTSTSKAR